MFNQPGDTLVVHAGTYLLSTYYDDMVTPPVCGTSNAWITITGEAAARPILAGCSNLFAAVAYMFMFGMMFGDVGHGALLLVGGLVLRTGRIRRLEKLQKVWKFVVGAGLASMVFGVLYGTAFGPTGLVPVLWLDPLTEPVPLLLAAVLLSGCASLSNRTDPATQDALFVVHGVDGAGPFRVFWSMVLPMSRPILGVVSVFAVIASWKDFLWPLLVLRNPDLQPLSVRLPTLRDRASSTSEDSDRRAPR